MKYLGIALIVGYIACVVFEVAVEYAATDLAKGVNTVLDGYEKNKGKI